MLEEGDLPVNLGHATLIDIIWDFQIQGMENEAGIGSNIKEIESTLAFERFS